MPSPVVHSVKFEKENVDPNDASSPTSKPAKRKRSTAATTAIQPTSPLSSSFATDEPAADNKNKRKKSSTAPRTLTKEELADYIARGEFWQKTEAAEGEGDGYRYGRGDDVSDGQEGLGPVYEDCNEIRRKINAFLKSGRMTQTGWCKLLGVSSGSYQNFMKAKGPYGGSGNTTYVAAAHFFESLRLLEHRPKSAKRVKEEEVFGKYGRCTQTLSGALWCLKEDQVVRDEFGRVRVIPSKNSRRPSFT